MRRIFIGLILGAVLWAAGLVAFIGALPSHSLKSEFESEGVVVFTGGGGARISAGMEIFKNGEGERLLISGVHPETSRERLSQLWTGEAKQFECCVDIGRQAQSTRGNAEELKIWAAEQNFNRIILVTSEYHMPRALLVAQTEMPGVEIKPYTIRSGLLNERGRPATFDALRMMAGEYSKYLVAKVQTLTG